MRHTWHVLCATGSAGADVDLVLTGDYFRLPAHFLSLGAAFF